MPLQTFNNLEPFRKKEIESVLRDIFYKKPITQVHVSEIVQSLNISRGAFYKYFEDLNDAFEYIISIDKNFFHKEIFKAIEESEYQIIEGLQLFLKNWLPETSDDLSYKSLHLLKQTNPGFVHKRHNIPKIMLNEWQRLLKLNQFEINERNEAISFLYFLTDLVMQTMILALEPNETKESVLEEFNFRIKWLLKGVRK